MKTTKLKKIHRWMAALIGAFIVFQGLTGAVSQQRFALLAASEPDVYAVSQVTGTSLGPHEIIKALQQTKPDFRPAHVMLPMNNSPATAAIVMGGRKPEGIDMSRSVTVDQYSGAVIAERKSSGGWVGTVTGWHKWSNYGITGRLVVTVFGLTTAVFLFTGILLWLRTRSYAARMSKLTRVHRGLGIVLALVLTTVSISGVYLNLASWQERSQGLSVVASNMRAGMRAPQQQNLKVNLEQAWSIATQQLSKQRLAAFSDVGTHAAQYWFAFTDTNLKRTDVLVHPQTGQASLYPSGLITNGDGLRGWLYSIHTGDVFGEFGGIVMTAVGLMLLFWPISGALMWRRRAKQTTT